MAEIETNEHITISREGKKRQKVSVPKPNNSVECDICGYSCSKQSTLKAHIASVHEEKKDIKM